MALQVGRNEIYIFGKRFLPLLSGKMNFASDKEGSPGSIREGGGAFSKKGKAHEEEYFRKLQLEQVKAMKGDMEKAIAFHEEQIKHHQEELQRYKENLQKIQSDQK